MQCCSSLTNSACERGNYPDRIIVPSIFLLHLINKSVCFFWSWLLFFFGCSYQLSWNRAFCNPHLADLKYSAVFLHCFLFWFVAVVKPVFLTRALEETSLKLPGLWISFCCHQCRRQQAIKFCSGLCPLIDMIVFGLKFHPVKSCNACCCQTAPCVESR